MVTYELDSKLTKAVMLRDGLGLRLRLRLRLELGPHLHNSKFSSIFFYFWLKKFINSPLELMLNSSLSTLDSRNIHWKIILYKTVSVLLPFAQSLRHHLVM